MRAARWLWLLVLGLAASAVAAPATPDPACTGSQAATVDWSGGTVTICAPWLDANGAALDDSWRLNCTVDNGSVVIDFLGVAPGAKVAKPSPAGVYGRHDVHGACDLLVEGGPSLAGEVGPTVAATFPARPGPRPPLLCQSVGCSP